MKQFFAFVALCICICAVPSTAQTPAASPEKRTYLKVSINTQNDALAKMSAMGIAVDHGELENGRYVTDINNEEYKQIKNLFDVTVLETDMEKAYAENIRKDLLNPNPPAGERFPCSYTTPTNFNYGSMGSYLTYQEMLNELDEMAALYPNLITVKAPLSSTLTTAQGRPLYYVKISDNPEVNESEPGVLYTALHHAREPVSMMSLIFYMHYLLENYQTDTEIQNLVNSVEMYFVPCVNPDGYVYNQSTNPNGGGLWRKNRRLNGDGSYGVDLNRNYGYQWGLNSGSSPTTTSDTYRGPSAFSEPETRMIRDFCIDKQFATSLNSHSYGNYLIHQWEYVNTVAEPTTFASMGAALTSCNSYRVGNAFQTVGYLASGGATDWMYGEQTAKPKMYAFTPEIGTSFWPATSSIIPLCNGTMKMYLQMSEIARCGQITANAGSDVAVCSGSSAALSASVSGGSAPYTYAWSNGAAASSISVSPTATTTYTVTITSADGCSATDNVQVTVSNCSICGSPGTTVNTNSFETSLGIWTDPGVDCAILTANANTGTRSLQLRDNTTTSLTSTSSLNLSAYSKIVVSFSYVCTSFDNSAEDFWLQISTNGGTTYTTVEEWNLSDEIQNGVRRNENITINGPFTSTTRIRFRCDASDDDDQVFLDDITITGCLPGNFTGSDTDAALQFGRKLPSEAVSEVKIYPNPATNNLNVQLFSEEASVERISVYNAFGALVKSQDTALSEGWNLVQLELSQIPAGAYYVSDGKRVLGRFMKTDKR